MCVLVTSEWTYLVSKITEMAIKDDNFYEVLEMFQQYYYFNSSNLSPHPQKHVYAIFPRGITFLKCHIFIEVLLLNFSLN